jgi:pyruvate dehydrogenase E2 component (dihydrolipoamide acetyltransferase)
MAIEVILPKVDMDMDHGSISKWHVKDGDTVKKGQAVFEIETDKSAMEIESPGDGVIRISSVKEKEAIAIGTVVAMIYASGEAAKSFSSPTTPAVIPAKAGIQTLTELRVEKFAQLLWHVVSPNKQASHSHRSQAPARVAALLRLI